jgi:hypothetical protein
VIVYDHAIELLLLGIDDIAANTSAYKLTWWHNVSVHDDNVIS